MSELINGDTLFNQDIMSKEEIDSLITNVCQAGREEFSNKYLDGRMDTKKEFTLEITQMCEHDCTFCSSNASEKGEHLSVNEIKHFLRSQITTGSRINISGGEPLSHPNFYEIYQLCKQITDDVWVYTNVLDKIKYNANIIKEIQIEANVCVVPGKEVYIPKNVDRVRFLKLVKQGKAEHMNSVDITVSGNDCKNCDHKILQADGQIASAPCKKCYR